ncbi:MAG: hypothetical protein KDK40_04600 [Chlamydiia bacterium]|nr:hypothetical protein [Chlamydiia bacterium]
MTKELEANDQQNLRHQKLIERMLERAEEFAKEVELKAGEDVVMSDEEMDRLLEKLPKELAAKLTDLRGAIKTLTTPLDEDSTLSVQKRRKELGSIDPRWTFVR